MYLMCMGVFQHKVKNIVKTWMKSDIYKWSIWLDKIFLWIIKENLGNWKLCTVLLLERKEIYHLQLWISKFLQFMFCFAFWFSFFCNLLCLVRLQMENGNYLQFKSKKIYNSLKPNWITILLFIIFISKFLLFSLNPVLTSISSNTFHFV